VTHSDFASQILAANESVRRGDTSGLPQFSNDRARHTTSIGSKDVYLIMRLNQILKEVHPREYPRLDLMPEFVWRISDKVKPVFWN
jgi:hypothetical protein